MSSAYWRETQKDLEGKEGKSRPLKRKIEARTDDLLKGRKRLTKSDIIQGFYEWTPLVIADQLAQTLTNVDVSTLNAWYARNKTAKTPAEWFRKLNNQSNPPNYLVRFYKEWITTVKKAHDEGKLNLSSETKEYLFNRLNAKGGSYKIFDSNQLIVDVPTQEASETPRLPTNDVNPDGTGGRTDTTPVKDKSEADPTRPAVTTGAPAGTTPAVTNKDAVDNKKDPASDTKDTKAPDKKVEIKDDLPSFTRSSFDSFSRNIAKEQEQELQQTDERLLAPTRTLKSVDESQPPLNPTAYANGGRGPTPIAHYINKGAVKDQVKLYFEDVLSLEAVANAWSMSPETKAYLMRAKKDYQKLGFLSFDNVTGPASDRIYNEYAPKINLVERIVDDIKKFYDGETDIATLARKYQIDPKKIDQAVSKYFIRSNDPKKELNKFAAYEFLYRITRDAIVEDDPKWTTLPQSYLDAIDPVTQQPLTTGSPVTPAPKPAPGKPPGGSPPGGSPPTGKPPTGKPPTNNPPPTDPPTEPPTQAPETVTIDLGTDDFAKNMGQKLSDQYVLKGLLELMSQGMDLTGLLKFVKVSGWTPEALTTLSLLTGPTGAMAQTVFYAMGMLNQGYAGFNVGRIIGDQLHLYLREGGLFKNDEERSIFEEYRRKAEQFKGSTEEYKPELPTLPKNATMQSIQEQLAYYYERMFGSGTTETPQENTDTGKTGATGAPTSTPKPTRTRPPPLTFPPKVTQDPDPGRAWAAKQIEVDDASEPLLRPSFYEGGSEFVTTMNHDVNVQTIDELMWQSFKNYQWEVNQTKENPLWGQQLAEEAARFASPLINEELIPEQNMEAEQELHYAKSNLLAFEIKLSGSGDSFMDAVPLDGEVNVDDSREHRVKQTEREFRDVDLEDWYSMPENNPLKKFTATEGTQLPDTERRHPGTISSYWWESGLRENQFIFQTRS